MKTLVTILLLLLPGILSAQEPAILSMEGVGGNGYDRVHPLVIKTSDGGGIIRFTTGSDQGTGNINTDCNPTTTSVSSVFRKYDADGNIEWEECYPITDSGYLFMYPLSNGDIVLGGSRNANQWIIHKTDENGNILWAKNYGGSAGESLYDMKATANGGYIMLGTSNSSDGDVGFHYGGMFSLDIWVLKVDSNGEKEWSTVIGGTGDEDGRAIVATANGGYYVVGTTTSTDYDCVGNHGNGDAFVARLDDTGHILWTRCLGGSGNDGYISGWGVGGWAVEDANGGVLFSTVSYSNDLEASNNHGSSDIWVIDIDSNNNIVWDKFYGTADGEEPFATCISTDGTIWTFGFTDTGWNDINTGAWLIHTDNMGNMINERKFPGPVSRYGTMLLPLQGGMVLIGGHYEGGGTGGDMFPTSWYGVTDIFLAKVAPWSTDVPIVPANQLGIYPNPTTDRVFIDITGTKEYTLTIMDILGRKIYNVGGKEPRQGIDVGQWAKGVYHVQVTCDGQRYATQLVVQ